MVLPWSPSTRLKDIRQLSSPCKVHKAARLSSKSDKTKALNEHKRSKSSYSKTDHKRLSDLSIVCADMHHSQKQLIFFISAKRYSIAICVPHHTRMILPPTKTQPFPVCHICSSLSISYLCPTRIFIKDRWCFVSLHCVSPYRGRPEDTSRLVITVFI